MAGAMRSTDWSCSVTVMPRSAHTAAMSPPITPAPTTCTWRGAKSLSLPKALRRSCRWKTRTRLRAVGEVKMLSSEDGSLAGTSSALPPYFSQMSTIANGAG